MYHKFMEYDHVIAYDQLTFVVNNIKAVQYYHAAIKLRYTKFHLDIVRSTILSCFCTVLNLVGTHFAFIGSCMFPLNHDIVRCTVP